MVQYATALIGRNGPGWDRLTGSAPAIPIAQFREVPTSMLLTWWVGVTLSASGSSSPVARETASTARQRLCKLDGSVHARYSSDRRSVVSRVHLIPMVRLAGHICGARGSWASSSGSVRGQERL